MPSVHKNTPGHAPCRRSKHLQSKRKIEFKLRMRPWSEEQWCSPPVRPWKVHPNVARTTRSTVLGPSPTPSNHPHTHNERLRAYRRGDDISSLRLLWRVLRP